MAKLSNLIKTRIKIMMPDIIKAHTELENTIQTEEYPEPYEYYS